MVSVDKTHYKSLTSIGKNFRWDVETNENVPARRKKHETQIKNFSKVWIKIPIQCATLNFTRNNWEIAVFWSFQLSVFSLFLEPKKKKKIGWSHFYGISLVQKVFFRSSTRTWPIPAKWIRTKCGTIKKMVNWEFSAIMHPIKIISLCGKKIISVWILTKCNTISLEIAKNTKWNEQK